MRTFFPVLLLCFSSLLSAQNDDGPRREVGIQIQGINFDGNNSFSALFKKQVKPNVWWRYSAASAGLNFFANQNNNVTIFNIRLAVGRELRLPVGERFTFYRGPQLSMGFRIVYPDNNDVDWIIRPGIGYVLGFQHEINRFWGINIETTPTFSAEVANPFQENFSLAVAGGFSNTVELGVFRRF
ncbi:MAG: hypothetical protein JNL02_02620 [Saprospiraceae bacterium]|nr:hypothetical protein [Saprospiraceae bacterium]